MDTTHQPSICRYWINMIYLINRKRFHNTTSILYAYFLCHLHKEKGVTTRISPRLITTCADFDDKPQQGQGKAARYIG